MPVAPNVCLDPYAADTSPDALQRIFVEIDRIAPSKVADPVPALVAEHFRLNLGLNLKGTFN